MKRICFLVDSIFSFGGVQRVTAVIAKELSRYCEVTVVTLENPEDKDTSMYGLDEQNICFRFFHYPKLGIVKRNINRIYSFLYRKVLPHNALTSHLYALSSFPSPLRKALADELNAGKYDAVIGVHGPLAVRLATIRRRLTGMKAYGWIHNSYRAMFSNGSPYAGPELISHYEHQYRRLDKVVLLCDCDRKCYSPNTQEVCTIIHNPLTLKPGLPSDGSSKRFLAVGRFSPRHKGFDLLIEAFHIFAKENNTWCLDIVGEGPEEEMYRSLIRKYGLEQRITLHPFTKDIQMYYSRASVFVLSSRWEGFGLVLVEAMAHGLPIVSSDLPSSREVLGDFGMYFANGDIISLAARLEDATTINHKRLSAEAMARAKRFEIAGITSEWKEMLNL